MLDYDIFRISLLMYQNFDFKDYKESFVKITKMIYKKHNEQIEQINNLPLDKLEKKKIYPTNQLWDEIKINTNPIWIMEFASFLKLDKKQYIKFLQENTFANKDVQTY